MKWLIGFIRGPVFFRYWLMGGFLPFSVICFYLAYLHSFAYLIGMFVLWEVWYWEMSTGICLSCRHFGTMHCFPQGPSIARIFSPRDGPVPRYRFYLHEFLNLLVILAPQPLLWQRPALAIAIDIWIVLAIVAGIPYAGASWLRPREEWGD